jgi:hypothetical protein
MMIRKLYSTKESEVKATIKIEFPVSSVEGQWKCLAELRVGDSNIISRVHYGLDCIQAFQNALVDMERLTKEFCSEFSMFEDGKPGENGFPMAVPIFMGHQITCQLEKILRDAVTAEINSLTKGGANR